MASRPAAAASPAGLQRRHVPAITWQASPYSHLERAITAQIEQREALIERVAAAAAQRPPPWAFQLAPLLARLRGLTVQIAVDLARWRLPFPSYRPYMWCGQRYEVRMALDGPSLVAGLPALAAVLAVPLRGNPLLLPADPGEVASAAGPIPDRATAVTRVPDVPRGVVCPRLPTAAELAAQPFVAGVGASDALGCGEVERGEQEGVEAVATCAREMALALAHYHKKHRVTAEDARRRRLTGHLPPLVAPELEGLPGPLRPGRGVAWGEGEEEALAALEGRWKEEEWRLSEQERACAVAELRARRQRRRAHAKPATT